MPTYRPVTDTWILARCKYRGGQKRYGGFPGGFLERARALLGVSIYQPVLHVCAGLVRHYPYPGGFGPNDKTLDLDPLCEPDYLADAREPFPPNDPYGVAHVSLAPTRFFWPAILIDRPYTAEDADRYPPGKTVLPTANDLLKHALAAVTPGGKVGMLDYILPSPPKDARFVAAVSVIVGFNNRVRLYSVFERGME